MRRIILKRKHPSLYYKVKWNPREFAEHRAGKGRTADDLGLGLVPLLAAGVAHRSHHHPAVFLFGDFAVGFFGKFNDVVFVVDLDAFVFTQVETHVQEPRLQHLSRQSEFRDFLGRDHEIAHGVFRRRPESEFFIVDRAG